MLIWSSTSTDSLLMEPDGICGKLSPSTETPPHNPQTQRIHIPSIRYSRTSSGVLCPTLNIQNSFESTRWTSTERGLIMLCLICVHWSTVTHIHISEITNCSPNKQAYAGFSLLGRQKLWEETGTSSSHWRWRSCNPLIVLQCVILWKFLHRTGSLHVLHEIFNVNLLLVAT